MRMERRERSKNGQSPSRERSKNGQSPSEENDKCRSLVCDSSGIIIAEMVYRCMICYYVTDSITESKAHYQSDHMNDDEEEECESAPVQSSQSTLSTNRSFNNIKHSNGNHRNNNNNPLLPDISLYEDGSPVNLKFTSTNNNHLSSTLDPSSLSPGGTISQSNGSNTKSGYVNCAVCGVTRFYSCVQRRYGQFTCVTCYRYFRTFLLKPKRFACPNLGQCPLNVRTRCRACWIKGCISVFSVDARRQQVIDANLPVKKMAATPNKLPPSSGHLPPSSGHLPPSSGHLPPPPPLASYHSNGQLNHNNNESERQSYESYSPILEPEVSLTEGDEEAVDSEMNGEMDSSEYSELPSPSKLANVRRPSLNKLIVTGKKVWSCGKCVTCTAEDCGKCIYCLDRPKFGGPFIKKQRCIKRRCLMKIKNKTNTLLRKS